MQHMTSWGHYRKCRQEVGFDDFDAEALANGGVVCGTCTRRSDDADQEIAERLELERRRRVSDAF